MEGHRFKCEERFAGFVDRLDLFLEALRRGHRPQPSKGINEDGNSAGIHTEYVANKATIAHVPTLTTDADDVIGRGHVVAGTIAHRRVVAAGGVVPERSILTPKCRFPSRAN